MLPGKKNLSNVADNSEDFYLATLPSLLRTAISTPIYVYCNSSTQTGVDWFRVDIRPK